MNRSGDGKPFNAMPSEPHPDDIADCVLTTFNSLPAKSKPRQLADGRREWAPLAGIILSRGDRPANHRDQIPNTLTAGFSQEDHDPPSLTCVSLATGMKCLPRDKVPVVRGCVLHDWHAEVLCLRGFNRWLVDECAELATTNKPKEDGKWLKWNGEGEDNPAFSLHDDVKIHMYCSEAPCGDASMELIMAAQEDATPWTSTSDDMLGRGNFDQLGVVRRKPSRPDAPICWSKSCSDKIALKQCVGLLSGLASMLVSPCYLETLVLPEAQCVPEAAERAFGAHGRMACLVGVEMEKGCIFKPFIVKTTKSDFSFSKQATATDTPQVSSNLSALWTPGRKEILINGVLQGRKQMDSQGASCTSRRRMWETVRDVAIRLDLQALRIVLEQEKYGDMKGSQLLQGRASAKRIAKDRALKGWKKNYGDEDWSLRGS